MEKGRKPCKTFLIGRGNCDDVSAKIETAKNTSKGVSIKITTRRFQVDEGLLIFVCSECLDSKKFTGGRLCMYFIINGVGQLVKEATWSLS